MKSGAATAATEPSSGLLIFDHRALADRDYWRTRLAGEFAAAGPVADYAPRAGGGEGPREVEFELPRALVRRLEKLTRNGPFLTYTTLLAALAVCLHRYSGSRRLAVGSPARRSEGEAPEQGAANPLPIVLEVAAGASFRDLLAETRSALLAAYEHGSYPYSRMLRDRGETGPDACLFAVSAAYAPIHRSMPENGQRLHLDFDRREGRIVGRARGDGRVLAAASIERFVHHLLTLLGGALGEPGAPIAALSALDEGERRRVLVEWNRTDGEYPRGASVGEVWSRQAASSPDAVALAFADEQLSYRRLDEVSGRLARRLAAAGVRPEARVALVAERSAEMVVATLAVVKAGGVYVPVDPTYPPERQSFMLGDCGARVLLVQRHVAPGLPSFDGEVLVLGDGGEDREPPPEGSGADPAAVQPGPAFLGGGQLLYVMYTSGSTGRPKGIEIPHRGALRLVLANPFADFGPEQVWLQLAPISFDLATLEIWGCLLHGGRLEVAPPAVPSLAELARILLERRITSLWLTAGLFHLMVEERIDGLSGLSQLLAGGDVLSPTHVETLRRRLPGCRLINGYGPTEATTFACCHTVEGSLGAAATVPIGPPIANTRVYLLGPSLEPVGMGMPAELWIAGDGLARGYGRRARRTADRFRPDPFGPRPGGRLYRSGDRARHLPGGIVEFLGRLDGQVKLRGFRVEPGEVETCLARLPGVANAVVLVRRVEGEARLSAFVTPSAEAEITPSGLRRALGRSLPSYMLPGRITVVDAFPLTPNGKVDRAALVRLEGEDLQADRSPELAVGTPLERRLAAFYRELTGVGRVGRSGDFFDLGGHSLMATRLVSRIARELDVELPLAAVFEEPTVAGLARRVEAAIAAGAAGSGAIPPQPRGGDFPLSSAQERLWVLAQLSPDPAYNVPLMLRLRGRLDAGALAGALHRLVERHETLRTRFPRRAGRPVQRIDAPGPLPLGAVDLTALEPGEARARVDRLASREARSLFDLARGPVLRVRLFRLAADDHVLLLILHHIAADGWSLGILAEELALFYDAAVAGEPADLPRLEVGYADYAAWERERLASGAMERQLAWWRRRLEGLGPLELPADHPRPVVQDTRGRTLPFRLPAALSEALGALARREGTTPFIPLLAAFKALLWRYTGRADLAVGTPIANRRKLEVEPLIGFFVNTLVLRSSAAGDPVFTDFLARVGGAAREAYDHQDLPFEELVDALQPERDIGRAPLFQVALALQNAPLPPVRAAGLTFRQCPLDTGTSKFDLTLSFTEDGRGLDGAAVYAGALFEAVTIERMVAHFANLLRSAVADPHRRLSRLSLLSGAERHQLRREWNPTAPGPLEDAVHRRFAREARSRPGAVALVCGEERLSYGELARRARRLAGLLRRRGVGPDGRVMVLAERRPELLVAVLGVLFAGGAYIPVEPGEPTERVAGMLADAAPRVVLGGRSALDSLPATDVRSVALEDLANLQARSGGEALPAPVAGGNLAYVIYTSGSTGRPKGVGIPHAALSWLLTGTERWFRFGPADVWTLFHSPAFDFSVWEIWGALVFGGTLVVVPREETRAPGTFYALLVKERVTVLNQTPAAFEPLAAVDDGARAPLALRRIVFGGEALSPAALEPWLRRRGDRIPRLINMYGITETTVHVTYRPVTLADLSAAGASPVGRPIPGAEVHLLDRRFRGVPAGVPGEICVGGCGLARGYLRRPGLTAERFVPHPCPARPGERLYRSGDLARRRPDGALEYGGRRDLQVKIRGFRVEPGEVEAAVRAVPEVAQAVVAVGRGPDGKRELIAYVVPRRQGEGTLGGLREVLRETLPEHMVPAVFVPLAELPLNRNGKVDRKALPAPVRDRSQADAPYVAPRNRLEEEIAGAWRQVLGLPEVGVRDNFFDLGGNSLLLVELHGRLVAAVGDRLTVVDLFQYPTVEALAGRLDERERPAAAPVGPPEEVGVDHPARWRASRQEAVLAARTRARRGPA